METSKVSSFETTSLTNISSTTLSTTTTTASSNPHITQEGNSIDSTTMNPTKKLKYEKKTSEISLHHLIESIGAIQILKTINTILLACSSLLPTDMRTQIERIVSHGLTILQKGVLRSNHSSDTLSSNHDVFISSDNFHLSGGQERGLTNSHNNNNNRSTHKTRIRRANAEKIRLDSDFQQFFLKLACTEVLSNYNDGSRSGNLSRLKDVCILCSQYDDTSTEALHILLVLDNLLFPSSGSVPTPTNIISSSIYHSTTPSEEIFLVNKTMKVIQEHKEYVEHYKQNFRQVDQIANKNNGNDQVNEINKIISEKSYTESRNVEDKSTFLNNSNNSGGSSSNSVSDSNSDGFQTNQLKNVVSIGSNNQQIEYQKQLDLFSNSPLNKKIKTPPNNNDNNEDDNDDDELPELNVDADPDEK